MTKVFRRNRRNPTTGRMTESRNYYFWLNHKERVSTGTSDIAQARRIAKDAVAREAHKVGRAVPMSEKTVRGLVRLYLGAIRQRCSDLYFANVTRHLAAFADEFGATRAESVSAHQIDTFVQARSVEKSNASYNRCLQAVRSFYSWCQKHCYVPANPALSAILPNRVEERRKLPYLTSKEVSELLRICRRRRYQIKVDRERRPREHHLPLYLYYFVRMGLHTGGRKSELTRMRWRHIEFDECTVLFPRTKNKRARELPVRADLLEELIAFRTQLKKLGLPTTEDDFVFLSPVRESSFVARGETPNPTPNLRRAFGKLLSLAGINPSKERQVGIHSLRHTYITELMRLGTPIKDVQAMAGHSKITTTERYLHESKEVQRRAVQRLPY